MGDRRTDPDDGAPVEDASSRPVVATAIDDPDALAPSGRQDDIDAGITEPGNRAVGGDVAR
ncbi:hypothetical protein [Sphingomonas sp.]|uniref:hypothetical protein n=1 Tax=Sphingomonas sp. TaxID=28214 RepID=UPI002DD644D6|nr:hypothetical protein [Sphingomonas sp.]